MSKIDKENKDIPNINGKPWSQDYYCDNDECQYTENELFMPGDIIPHMYTDRFCPMCGGIIRRLDVGNNNKRYRWRD